MTFNVGVSLQWCAINNGTAHGKHITYLTAAEDQRDQQQSSPIAARICSSTGTHGYEPGETTDENEDSGCRAVRDEVSHGRYQLPEPEDTTALIINGRTP